MAEPRLLLAVPIVSGGSDHAVLEAIVRGFTPAPPADYGELATRPEHAERAWIRHGGVR